MTWTEHFFADITLYCMSLLFLSILQKTAVCSHQQPEADLQGTSTCPWRLQVHVWWETGDRVVGAQLLLPLWKHRIHHGLQRRQQTRAQAVPRRPWLRACHTSPNNHPLLPIKTRASSVSSPPSGDLNSQTYLYATYFKIFMGVASLQVDSMLRSKRFLPKLVCLHRTHFVRKETSSSSPNEKLILGNVLIFYW